MIKKIFILLGLPGSGKGTQGKILAEYLNIPHISTGDIFRNAASKNTSDSKLLNEYMQQGKLIPTQLVNKTVLKFILTDECSKGCVLDGYPRNLEQAEYLIKHIDADIISIFFNIDEDTVKKRILERYNCSSCGAIYNKYFNNPKVENICDNCGNSNFTSRQDDDEGIILSRIEEYKNETLPLITKYYKDNNKFYTIDANRSKEEVTASMLEVAKKV